jgi:biotin carboxyl carrier protein
MRQFVVTVEDKKYQVSVEEVGETKASINQSAQAPAPKKVEGETVKAPLAGTILSVKVHVGDKVELGTVLLTLESNSGTVKEILVTPGQTVSTGEPLIILE